MPTFRYRAVNSAGLQVKGTLAADDKEKFFAEAKARGLYLVNYREEEKRDESGDLGARSQLPLKKLAVFCRQTASLLKVGVSLVKAIDILYQQTTDKKMKSSIQKLYESVQKGSLLSEGMRRQPGKYPQMMINLIESGEESGTIDSAIDKLATQYESDLKLKNKVTSAMIYPIIIAVLGVGVVVLMCMVVLPQFMDMFEKAGVTDMPATTAILLGLAGFLTDYWYIVLFAIAVLVFGFRYYIKTEKGRLAWDGLKFKIPLLKGIQSRLVTVRFCRTLATLFACGMPMLQSITIVSKVVNNAAVGAQLGEVNEDIRKGLSLSNAIRKVTYFPPLVHSMISIGEESGSLDTMLENAAGYFNDELENSIAKMVSMIEPIMICAMGGVVAFIILSIMQPMMQIYSSMG